MKRYFQKTTLILLALISLQCFDKSKTDKPIGLITEKAMVVSARQEASDIGAAIMEKGGNAFDAAIATQFALAVVYPVAGNIGGGGFMVYRTSEGKTGSIDYREKAPLAATKNMYLDEEGVMLNEKSLLGAHAVGIPGTVAGIFEIHKEFATLPMEELIQPAIDLAKNGIIITEKQARSIQSARENFAKANNYKILLDDDWEAGDLLKFVELSNTLERIKKGGKDGFYKGATARSIVNYVQELGGIITLEDLESYEAVWRKPISFDYKGHTITSMSLPSSGGICLAQLLKSIEPFDLRDISHNSVEYIQLLTEAERRSYADRAHYLGDIDFVDVPIDSLTNSTYIGERMASFSWKNATKSEDILHGKILGYESEETTHFSIIDQFGNAVSVTTTLNTGYGSKVYVKGSGFFLNNEMDDFSAKPGVPNIYGLLGSEANSIAPGKRMLSSMTPTIIEKKGELKMVVGTPGGATIITSVLQNILNVLDYKMGMQESVSSARFHHQWLPDIVRMELEGFDPETLIKLKKLGYIIPEKSYTIGRVDAILVRADGKLEAGADRRGDDAAAGF